jgi:hypothetical protein
MICPCRCERSRGSLSSVGFFTNSSESPMLVYTSTTKYENVLAPVGDMSSAVIGAMSPAQNLIPATFRHHELSPRLDGSTYRKVSTTRVAR